MDFELANVCLWGSYAKEPLCVQKMRILSEEASKEPEYHWWASRIGIVRQLVKLGQ